MRMRKGQTAMEYLMTYGWAILIIMVVLAVLFYLGVLNPTTITPNQCAFPAGFTCVTNKLASGNSKLYVVVGQGTGHSIMVLGINCTKNSSADFATNGVITYGTGNNVTIASGSSAVLSNPAGPAWMNITCKEANGADPTDKTIGALYSGKIYIKYTELDTMLNRTVVGTYTTKYEA